MIRGSPPQVRGKHLTAYSFARLTRITPAGAGKTLSRPRRRKGLPDHPRRCGENRNTQIPRSSSPGSPPQVRGKQNVLVCHFCVARITPAGAGKTYIPQTAARSREDHPRRCGENGISARSKISHQGSPPQVRGKPPQSRFSLPCCGITPAGAGKTASV